MKGRRNEREDGLSADGPFNSETVRTVRSLRDGWGVKELGRNELKGCKPQEYHPAVFFSSRSEGNKDDAHLTSALTNGWQTQGGEDTCCAVERST